MSNQLGRVSLSRKFPFSREHVWNFLKENQATISQKKEKNDCSITWTSTFKPIKISRQKAESMVKEVYQDGFHYLEKALNQSS